MPPLYVIAKQLGCNEKWIRTHFRELNQEIKSKGIEQRHDRSLLRSKQNHQEIEEVIRKLIINNIYPSMRKVTEILPNPAMMKSPENRAKWRELKDRYLKEVNVNILPYNRGHANA